MSCPYSCSICGADANVLLPDNIALCKPHYDDACTFQRAVEREATIAEGGPVPVPLCPRRATTPPFPGHEWPAQDVWEYGHGLVGGGTRILTCSFCGGAHPHGVLATLAEGGHLDATTKRYKAYLIDSDGGTIAKVYFFHFDTDQLEALRAQIVEARP